MTDLIAELAEVVRLSADDDQDSMIGAGYAVRFIRTHHAEIEEMARDAARWRYVVTHAEWIRDEDDTLMAVRLAGVQVNLESVGMRTDAIDQAMHDSAREDGNE
jgi:hypothetical protein